MNSGLREILDWTEYPPGRDVQNPDVPGRTQIKTNNILLHQIMSCVWLLNSIFWDRHITILFNFHEPTNFVLWPIIKIVKYIFRQPHQIQCKTLSTERNTSFSNNNRRNFFQYPDIIIYSFSLSPQLLEGEGQVSFTLFSFFFYNPTICPFRLELNFVLCQAVLVL